MPGYVTVSMKLTIQSLTSASYPPGAAHSRSRYGRPMSDVGLRTERDGDVELLVIDRPEARNALTFELYDALEAAVRETTAR